MISYQLVSPKRFNLVFFSKIFESNGILAPVRNTFNLQTIINKATTTNQMELLTLEEAKFLIGTEFKFSKIDNLFRSLKLRLRGIL